MFFSFILAGFIYYASSFTFFFFSVDRFLGLINPCKNQGCPRTKVINGREPAVGFVGYVSSC